MAKKGSVLICDDEEIMRDVLETILSGAGYRVEITKTGEEAIEAYLHNPFDVVLMDVSMPALRMSALEETDQMDREVRGADGDRVRDIRHRGSQRGKKARRRHHKAVPDEQIIATLPRAFVNGRKKKSGKHCVRQWPARSIAKALLAARRSWRAFFVWSTRRPARSTTDHGESGTGKELVAKAIHQAALGLTTRSCR